MAQMTKVASRRQVQRNSGGNGGRQRKLVAVGVAMPSTRPPASRRAKRSKVEIIKEESDFLRHPLMEQLVTPATHIDEASMQLMKFHGSYQQDNRDMRKFGAVRKREHTHKTKFPSHVAAFFAFPPTHTQVEHVVVVDRQNRLCRRRRRRVHQFLARLFSTQERMPIVKCERVKRVDYVRMAM